MHYRRIRGALVLSPAALAFRIEGFEWGDDRKTVIGKLGDKGWPLNPTTSKQIVEAKQDFFDWECVVQFLFNRELKLLTASAESFQLTLDNANSQLNPLGLSPSAIAFDIDPKEMF